MYREGARISKPAVIESEFFVVIFQFLVGSFPFWVLGRLAHCYGFLRNFSCLAEYAEFFRYG